MASSVEDVCNLALRRIAYPTPIGQIFEGSRAARVAVEIYGQTRDDLQRNGEWDFCRQSSALVLLKTAPVQGYGWAAVWTSAYPPVPWIFEYAYPPGCLLIRSVRPTPTIILAYDPQPNLFVVADDPTVSPSKVVLTNLAGALAVFTAQIIDPTAWNSSFTDALVAALATRFQAALNPDANQEKERVQQEMQEGAVADAKPG